MSLGALLTALQFFFALTWIVYVIYLPALAAQAGLDVRHVPLILMMDQAIFIVCDWAAGMYADRVARLFRSVGIRLALVTLVSCAAFMALPWAAPHLGPGAFLGLTVLWSATSSALRAPPLVMVASQAPASQQPWLGAFYLLGLGTAAALGPYLGLALKDMDPRIPFGAASLALALFAVVAAGAEQHYQSRAAQLSGRRGDIRLSLMAPFVLAVLLLALGFQVHFAVNSAPGYLRFASPDQLPELMPLFWIGFNVALLPATLLPKWFGGPSAMFVGAALGVASFFLYGKVASLEELAAVQLLAGAAWAVALTSTFTAALEIGRPTREGFVTGALFSMLAMAAMARLATVNLGLPADPELGEYLRNFPFTAWALACLLAGALALRISALERG